MKIRSLLLGSVAAAGLSTGGAFAADLGVLTSLDVCDALGLSGLTISSDTNCLQITGEVKYKFSWGDFDNDTFGVATPADGGLTWIGGGDDGVDPDNNLDWRSRFDAWIKFVATADSDFGPAKAVLKLKQVTDARVDNEGEKYYGGSTTGDVDDSGPGSVVLDEAYVSIGDSTVIMAGKKGSIMNKGDDEPLTWLDLFNSEDVDRGVSWGPLQYDTTDVEGEGLNNDGLGDGGHVIQVTSDLGNGFTVSAGLENIDDSNTLGGAGTAVGVIAYAGEGISAHITGVAAGVLDGEVEAWGLHAGFAGTFDNFKVVLAGAYGHAEDQVVPLVGDYDYWNVLASASATFDMFTIAGAVEAVDQNGTTDFGAGASVSFAVTEGVTINVGGRWYEQNIAGLGDAWQVAAGVSAAVTESITVTGELGFIDNSTDELIYGSAKLAWAPGGGYTSSIKGTVTSETLDADVGYKLETEFKKTFE